MKATSDEQLEAFRRRITERLAEHGARVGVRHAEVFKLITNL